jgi:hypothetical protein
MDTSIANMLVFLIITLLYYLKKPTISLDDITDPTKMETYASSTYKFLGLYFLMVVAFQWAMNIGVISSACGGSVSENIGAAGLYTVIPWTLIFGIVIITIVVFPGFKSAFADVFGYYYVSSSANTLLTELLVDKDIDQTIEKGDSANKKELQDAADMIVKICGNMSILINQIVPSNFDSYWNILDPLMKPKYQHNSVAALPLKKELFDLVVTRDSVGETMWYVYTGILLSLIVQMKLATRACSISPATMEKNYQTYLDEEEKKNAEIQRATATTYTISA